MCGFKRDGKLKALALCDVGEYDYDGVGIAYDETKRHGQLTENLRSILFEEKITENDATNYCKENGLYSPQYACTGKKKMRDGCALCCNASEAIPLVIELQNIVKKQRPDRPPLRDYKYFIE